MIVALLVGLALAAQEPDPEVAVEQTGPMAWTLTVTVQWTADPGRAQLALLPTARGLCGRAEPEFGQYKFKGEEPLEDVDDASPSVTLVQEMTCREPNAANPPPARSVTVWSQAEAERLTPVVLQLSDTWLLNQAEGRHDLNYAVADEGLHGGNSPEWIAARSRARTDLGDAVSHQSVKVTWYVDPPTAPEPGVYAAVDYVADWKNAEECGYLVWHAAAAEGPFRAVRQEQIFLPRDLSSSQRDQVRRQYCILL